MVLYAGNSESALATSEGNVGSKKDKGKGKAESTTRMALYTSNSESALAMSEGNMGSKKDMGKGKVESMTTMALYTSDSESALAMSEGNMGSKKDKGKGKVESMTTMALYTSNSESAPTMSQGNVGLLKSSEKSVPPSTAAPNDPPNTMTAGQSLLNLGRSGHDPSAPGPSFLTKGLVGAGLISEDGQFEGDEEYSSDGLTELLIDITGQHRGPLISYWE
ncbi:hypothetical protein GYMLUDRAFT_250901 [Collybiopsis luxurians FD-317 M1]|uniref:Uncharacterized protein n=1 Tax=Collybiopsis luxurians FD-317 M1 TaxID=944289 RepID=A0A0D0BDV3_9AGAR|nr:hypothetical protein GYMLUDRAFT_250901 [Collybiopsis luxurians FD-317 M1]